MTLTRRTMLAAVSATLLARRRALAASEPVIVVGAGAAGLAAAETLRAAGRTVVLIEARDRIGGRAFTDTSLGPAHAFDAGAQYIHWAERNPWRGIAERLGVHLVRDAGGAGATLYVDGVRAPDRDRAQRRALFAKLSDEMTLRGRTDRSIRDTVRDDDPETAALAEGMMRLSLGEEADRVSLADYDRLWEGEDDLVPEGYGHLVARSYRDVPVRPGVVATALDWSGPGVAVETSGGRIAGSAAIVTVPVGVLKAGGLRFTPDLPAAHRDALAGLGMGAYTKIALALDLARLPDLRPGDLVSANHGDRAGPGPTMIFEIMPFGRAVAVATCGGDYARTLCAAGEGAAVADATRRLVAMLGGGARSAVTGGRLAGWWSDPFARGGYSIARPGHAEARAELRAPLGDRVFLAGEATAEGGAMTVGGATLEGRRAAADLLALRPI